MDSEDKALLDIVRHLSCGFAISAYDGLAKAQHRARLDWAEHDSARIVESVVFLLARMRAARAISFEFITTECPWCSNHICQSELQLMLLLRACRRNDNPRLAAAAQLVAAAGDPRGLMIAAVALACVMENCACHRGENASPTLH